MPDTGIRIDSSEFRSALKLYLKASSRDLPYIINKRAINIAFIAMRKTPSASGKRIAQNLLKKISVPGKKGKNRPPRAALLIASGSEKSGLKRKPVPGLYGSAMSEAIRDLIDRRQRTRGYIKSGFLKSIRDLEKRSPGRAKRKPRNVQDFSRLPGAGVAAKPGFNPTAEILNYASNSAKVAGPALQAAVNADARDMKQFAEKRMAKTAKRFSAR